jgi:hypothetical protein
MFGSDFGTSSCGDNSIPMRFSAMPSESKYCHKNVPNRERGDFVMEDDDRIKVAALASSPVIVYQNRNQSGAVGRNRCESLASVRCLRRFDSVKPDINVT